MKKIRSRIHEFLSEELIMTLDKICNNVVVADNNIKASTIKQTLDDFGIKYNELGPGTNRLAVLIDGYVFKIAMDMWGKQDNANEFAMSKELQPYVIKVYENNDLISVSEYVTLFTREEFREKRTEILQILSILSESYLLGDVGYVEKNFTNWGYRDDGDLAILDFAYIHIIHGEELLCPNDRAMLDYDANFYDLRCPQCRQKFSFSDIRRKISFDEEWAYINDVKNHSYQLTGEFIILNEAGEQDIKSDNKEETKMKEQEFTEEAREEGYSNALDRLRARMGTKGAVLNEDQAQDLSEVIEQVEEVIEEATQVFGTGLQTLREVNKEILNKVDTDGDTSRDENQNNSDNVQQVIVSYDENQNNVANVQQVTASHDEIDFEQIAEDALANGEGIVIESTAVKASSTYIPNYSGDKNEVQGALELEVQTANPGQVIEVQKSTFKTTGPVTGVKPSNGTDLVAAVHATRVESSSLRITRPDVKETDEEKYARLAKENGYDEE